MNRHDHPGDEVLAELEKYRLEHPDVYGGCYFVGDTLHVAFTEAEDDHLASIVKRLRERRVSAPPLVAVRVGHTFAHQRKVIDEIGARMRQLAESGVPITAVGLGAGLKVHIRLRAKHEGFINEVRDRYGDAVVFTIWPVIPRPVGSS